MKYKIGIFGSAIAESEKTHQKVTELVNAFLPYSDSFIFITGACHGIPDMFVQQIYSQNPQTEIWGFAPRKDRKELETIFPSVKFDSYSKLFYIPQNYEELFFADQTQSTLNEKVFMKYRNVISTANCDAGIIISGRWGTLNEFINLYYLEKVIGIYTGTGGIADEIEKLSTIIHKPSDAVTIYESDPQLLVKGIMEALEKTA